MTSNNPQEADDLAPEQKDRVYSMQENLETWLDTVIASMNGADY